MKLGLLKHAVLQLQMLQVKPKDFGRERELENAETWRKEGPLSPALIILLHSCVFTGRAAVRNCSATWAPERKTWRATPVGGVTMEKAMSREKT